MSSCSGTLVLQPSTHGGGSGARDWFWPRPRPSAAYTDLDYRTDDIVMIGRESAGVPDEVAAVVDEAVEIPMREGMRSLNVALAAAMIVGEALRQVGAGASRPE